MELTKKETRGVKEHPILFKGEMVRAILEGRKTQTRRLNLKTKYAVGDRLWVRETWTEWEGVTLYRATYGDIAPRYHPWSPSLFMPRDRARILLEVTALREEPLKSISENDAMAEGIGRSERRTGGMTVHARQIFYGLDTDTASEPTARAAYELLWESINGAGSWEENPTVKVITFKVVS